MCDCANCWRRSRRRFFSYRAIATTRTQCGSHSMTMAICRPAASSCTTRSKTMTFDLSASTRRWQASARDVSVKIARPGSTTRSRNSLIVPHCFLFTIRHSTSPTTTLAAEVVGRHEQVLGLLCGHVHWPVVRDWAGTVAHIMPSIAVDVRKGVDEDELRGDPVYLLHRLSIATGLVSQARRADTAA